MKCSNEICDNTLIGHQKKYCSRSCAAIVNNRGVRRHGSTRLKCLNCDEPVGRTSVKYCSHNCYNDYKQSEYIRKWQSGEVIGESTKNGLVPKPIRRHIFSINNNKCSKCGWSELNPYTKCNHPPLHIDHVDGNCTNNRPENLELLCPNCHSLTPTFGSLNESGNGRRKRGLM